jgi:hypothetical protein
MCGAFTFKAYILIQQELADKYQVGEASCNLIQFTEKGFKQAYKIKWITDLHVPIESRKQGLAKALMQQLGKEADGAQISLLAEVRPYEDNITQDQLESFYKRNGFVSVQDDPKLMLRIPVPPMLFESLKQKPASRIITDLYHN